MANPSSIYFIWFVFDSPGLLSYPPVKIADKNAKQTAIIRISLIVCTSYEINSPLYSIP